MSITIKQAMKRAKIASQQGNAAVALQLYNAVLQHQPNHPVARKALRKLQKELSHNQSVQTQATNPSQDQISALVNLCHSGQMAEAVQVCRELLRTHPQSLIVFNILGAALKAQGKSQEAVQAFDKAIQIKPDFAEAYGNRGAALQDLGQLKEAVASCDKAIQIKPDYAEAYSNRGNALQDLGQLKEAVASYDNATRIRPDYAEAYSNRGVALKALGQLKEAVASYDKAIRIKPDYAEAHGNRGNALQALGQLKEAVASYDKAIRIKPDYAEAYSNCGVALKALGQLKEAVASYDKAIQIRPDYAEAYCNRGAALKALGQLDAAIENYQQAVSIDPQNGLYWAGFADVLQSVKFTSFSDDLLPCLLQMLEQPTVRPRDVSSAMISALHFHPQVSPVLELSRSGRIDEDIDHLTAQLSTVPLLLRVMELSPIADLEVEQLFTQMRKAMLNWVTSGESGIQGLPFYAALALHCFTNEYVFPESEGEMQLVELLQQKARAALEKDSAIPLTWVALLGAYRPLNSFSWADDLLNSEWSEDLEKVITVQVNEVREEQVLRSGIPSFTSIDNKVSQLVRRQYEESPYPRWVNTALSDKPGTIRQVLKSMKLHLNFDEQQFSDSPDILVAGCGTGQHALATASQFLNCNVLAVDLSLSSLSYAIRKTRESGVTNIEYMQGDILELKQLGKQFDIIESAGVLHHMDDPIAGWRVLVDRLRPGGLMNIGLYSAIARRQIVEARKQIAEKKYTNSPDDIRRYREEIINMQPNSDPGISEVMDSLNFYSLSECRDLLFHVQEHCFTLPQIEVALKDLGLKFLGFEMKQSWIMSNFSESYPEHDAPTSLSLWHQFELNNPDIFRGMYLFWVQKA
jgi:tetratricopeptide (TPR) repeat protein